MRKDKIAGLVLGGRKVLRNGLLVALVGLWPALTHAETAVQAWIQRWGGPYYGDDCARAVWIVLEDFPICTN